MKNISVSIKGMSCTSCASHIEKSLSALPGVEKVKVDFVTKQADISGNKLPSEKDILQNIEQQGYEGSIKQPETCEH